MATFYTDIIEMILPVLVVFIPAVLTWSYLQSRNGFVGGAVIGICVGYSSGLLDGWAIVIAVVLMSAIIFIDTKIIGSGGDV